MAIYISDSCKKCIVLYGYKGQGKFSYIHIIRNESEVTNRFSR